MEVEARDGLIDEKDEPVVILIPMVVSGACVLLGVRDVVSEDFVVWEIL
jgi:hypothetical protein